MSPITPRFLDPLVLREDADLCWWLVEREFRYDSAILGARIIIPPGFATDLASVPRAPFTYWLAGDTGRKAGLIHDWLYTMKATDRATADAVFLEALEAEGIPAWRRRGMYLAVRWFGGSHW